MKENKIKPTYIYNFTSNLQDTPMDYWVKKRAFYWEVSTNSGDTEKFTFPTLEMQGKTIAIYLYPPNQSRDSAAGESYKTGG